MTPEVTSVPASPDGPVITPLAIPSDPAAKILVDHLNQNFQELVRAQRAEGEARGTVLAASNEETNALKAQFDTAATAVAEIDAELKRLQAALMAAEVASDATENRDSKDPRNSDAWAVAYDGWMRGGGEACSDDGRTAMARGNFYMESMEKATHLQLSAKDWDPMNAVVAGGLSTNFGPGAGVWARPQYDSEITRLLVEFSPIRSFVRVTQISAAEFVGVVRTTNRDTIEQTIEGDGGTQLTQKDRYDERRIRPYTYRARPALSEEMIQDSVINLEAEVLDDVSLDFAVDESVLFTVGSGANEPLGYATDTEVGGIPTEASGTISHKDLLNLALSLRPEYRRNGAYAFSTEAFRLAILDEDGFGRRLWQPSIQEGFPSLYNGFRYFESVAQADVVASSKSVFFADWMQFYRIADRTGTRIVRDEISQPGLVILNHSRRYGGKTWKVEAGKALTTKA